MSARLDETPCPLCRHPRSRVIESDSEVDEQGVKHTTRRRQCANGHRYTTQAQERVIGRYTTTVILQVTPMHGVFRVSTST